MNVCIKRIKLVLSACIGFAMMITSIVQLAELIDAVNDYRHTLKIWNQVPVDNVTIVPGGESCPPGSAELQVDYGDFPGTREFCDCDPSWVFSGQHSGRSSDTGPKGICWQNETDAGCLEVSQSHGQESLWFQSRVCVWRWHTGESGFDRPRAYGAEPCPTGYRRCGNATVGESTCAPSGAECPLTSFSRCPGAGWGPGFGLCLDRVSDGGHRPLALVETYPDEPCRTVRSGFRGGRDWRRGSPKSCVRSDLRYSQVLGRDERSFYQERARPISTVASSCAPCLGSTSKLTVIAVRPEVDWSPNCSVTRHELRALDGDTSLLEDYQIVIVTFGILQFLLIGIMYTGWELKQEDDAGHDDDTDEQLSVRAVKAGVAIVFCGIKAIPMGLGVSKVRRLDRVFTRMVMGVVCTSEADTWNTMTFLQGEFSKQADLSTALLIMLGVETLFELVDLYAICKARMPDVGNGEIQMDGLSE